MADWHDIKKAFERDAQKAEQAFREDEQALLKSIANAICSSKGVTALQAYKPEDALVFLEQPTPELKSKLGPEWTNVNDEKLETLVYSLVKKVKKSDGLLPWG